jgi:hypothetical protein
MPGRNMVSWTAMVQRYAMPGRNMVSWKASPFGTTPVGSDAKSKWIMDYLIARWEKSS